jgi:hypothetical protein
MIPMHFPQSLWHKDFDDLSGKFTPLVPEQLLQVAIRRHDATVAVAHEDAVGSELHRSQGEFRTEKRWLIDQRWRSERATE